MPGNGESEDMVFVTAGVSNPLPKLCLPEWSSYSPGDIKPIMELVVRYLGAVLERRYKSFASRRRFHQNTGIAMRLRPITTATMHPTTMPGCVLPCIGELEEEISDGFEAWCVMNEKLVVESAAKAVSWVTCGVMVVEALVVVVKVLVPFVLEGFVAAILGVEVSKFLNVYLWWQLTEMHQYWCQWRGSHQL
jgi:hypothetical protein